MTAEKGTVTAAEVIRNFGYWQQQALVKPLVVTHHGRARVMLISTDHYEELTAFDEPASHVQSNDLLEQVLANSREGFAVFDRDFKIVTMNRTSLEWLGLSAADVIGKTLTEFMAGERAPIFESMVMRVFRTGEAVSYELAGNNLRGRPLRVRSFPFGAHVASVFEDVSEQEALADSAVTLEAAQTALDLIDVVGTAEVNGNGRIAASNNVLARMTGLRPSDLEGSQLGDLFESGSQLAVREAMSSTLTDSRCRSVDAVLRVGSTSAREVSVSFAPLARGMSVTGVIAAIVPAASNSHDGVHKARAEKA